MPSLDPRPFGGPALSGGMHGGIPNPQEWQHQPGDHADSGILPLLAPISASGGVTFGFSTEATGTETFTGTAGVTFGFSLAATGTATAVETTFCDYDFADDTYDNAADTYDCGSVTTDTAPVPQWRPPRRQPVDDEDEEAVVLVTYLRRRFRL